MILWIVTSFGFYTLTFVVKYLGGDIFVNSYTSALAEVIAKLSAGGLILHTGLNRLFLVAFSLGTLGALLLCFNSEGSGTFVAISVFIAKFGFSQTWPANYISILLIFPTVLNSTTMGICNICARVCTMLAPLVVEIEPPYPMVIVTTGGLIAVVLSQFLKNTDTKTQTLK